MINSNEVFSKNEQTIYEKLPIASAFYLLDENTIYTLLVSDGMCKLFHLAREKMLGPFRFNKTKRVHPDDTKKFLQQLNLFLEKENETLNIVFRYLNNESNKYLWLKAEGYYIQLENKTNIAMVTFRNITMEINHFSTQKQLHLKSEQEYQEMQNILSAVVQKQNDFILKINTENKTVLIFAKENNFAHFPFGFSSYTYDQFNTFVLQHVHIAEGSTDSLLLNFKNLEKTADEGYSQTFKILINKKIAYKRFFLFHNNGYLYSAVFDATDLIEKERKKADELEKANNAQSRFLSRMSHDMRTPLGAVQSISHFGLLESKEKKSREYFQEIKNFSSYLLVIMNDILDVQKINNSSIVLHPEIYRLFDCKESIKSIIQNQIEKKQLHLNIRTVGIDDQTYVKLDKHRIQQILINLLTNAIKYTPQQGTINWTGTLHRNQSQQTLEIEIEDNGLGMSKKFQEHMYDAFTQEANDFSSIESGSGMGLSIVKGLVDQMKGTIDCQSTLGMGTCFTIHLPLPPLTKQEIAMKQQEDTHAINNDCLKGKHILLVEDIEINRLIAKKILEQLGLNVSISVNGKEAVQLVRKQDYDAILMDIRMPVMDGLTAAKEMRKFNTKVPIIALSANAFQEDIEISFQAGMDAHLAKPINKNQLTLALRSLCT